jgi:hypothetical protein
VQRIAEKIGEFRFVRIGLHHRALAARAPEGLLWFLIGTDDEYDEIVDS